MRGIETDGGLGDNAHGSARRDSSTAA